MSFKRILKKINWKRVILLIVSSPTIIVPTYLLVYWIGYDKGRNSIQKITVPNMALQNNAPKVGFRIKL